MAAGGIPQPALHGGILRGLVSADVEGVVVPRKAAVRAADAVARTVRAHLLYHHRREDVRADAVVRPGGEKGFGVGGDAVGSVKVGIVLRVGKERAGHEHRKALARLRGRVIPLIEELEHGAAVKKVARVHVVRDDLARRGDPAAAVELNPCVVCPVKRSLLRGFPRGRGAAPHETPAEDVFLVHGGVPVHVREERPELPRRIPVVKLPEPFQIAFRKTEGAKLRKICIAVLRRGGFRRGRFRRNRRFLRRVGERHALRRDVSGPSAGLLYIIPEHAVRVRFFGKDRNGAPVHNLPRSLAPRRREKKENPRRGGHGAGSRVRGERGRTRRGEQQRGKQKRCNTLPETALLRHGLPSPPVAVKKVTICNYILPSRAASVNHQFLPERNRP